MTLPLPFPLCTLSLPHLYCLRTSPHLILWLNTKVSVSVLVSLPSRVGAKAVEKSSLFWLREEYLVQLGWKWMCASLGRLGWVEYPSGGSPAPVRSLLQTNSIYHGITRIRLITFTSQSLTFPVLYHTYGRYSWKASWI